MFYIDPSSGDISVSRGDCADIATKPLMVLKDGSEEPIILGKYSCVIFTVKSKYSGKTLIKRILTEDNYVNGMLTVSIYPDETDTQPNGYEYSFVYVPDTRIEEEVYTYAQGNFKILHSVSKLTDLEGGTNE